MSAMIKALANATRSLTVELSKHKARLFSITFLFGVIIILLIGWNSRFASVLVILLTVSLLFWGKSKFVVLLALLLGGVSVHYYDVISSDNIRYIEERVSSCDRFVGVIVSDPITDHDNTTYPIKVGSWCDVRENKGRILLVRGKKYPIADVGGVCSVNIENARNKYLADYKKYLSSIGISGSFDASSIQCHTGGTVQPFTQIKSLIYRFKTGVMEQINSSIVEPYASLWLGIMFGDDHLFSNDMETVFQVTQTTHIIAASGFNIAVVEGILDKASKSFIRLRARSVLLIIAVFSVCLLANMSASIIRAYIMLVIKRICKIFGCSYDPLDALLYSTVLLQLIGFKPLQRIGYLLSSAATLGVVILYPAIKDMITKMNISHNLVNIFDDLIISFASSLAVYPVLEMSFRSGSLIGIITNYLVSDLVGMIFYIGFSWSLFFSKIPYLKDMVLNLQSAILEIFVEILRTFSEIFFSSDIVIAFDRILLVLGFITVIMVCNKRIKMISELYERK